MSLVFASIRVINFTAVKSVWEPSCTHCSNTLKYNRCFRLERVIESKF